MNPVNCFLVLGLFVVSSTLVPGSHGQGTSPNDAEQTCLNDYDPNIPQDRICSEREKLVLCLWALPGVIKGDLNQIFRIDELLNLVGADGSCNIDILDLAVGSRSNTVNTSVNIVQRDPTLNIVEKLDCANVFLNNNCSGPDGLCQAYKQYFACSIRHQLQGENVADLDLGRLQYVIEDNLQGRVSGCIVDVTAIVAELIQEEITTTTTTMAPMTTNPDDDIDLSLGPCIQALAQNLSTALSNEDICEKVEEYIRCAFEVSNIHHHLTEGFLELLETRIERNLATIGVHCDLDIHDIIMDLMQGQATTDTTTTASPITMATDAILNATTMAPSETDQIQICLYEFFKRTDSLPYDDQAICEPLKDYTECVLTVVHKDHEPLTPTQLQSIQDNFDIEFEHCQMDVSAIYMKVLGRITTTTLTTTPSTTTIETPQFLCIQDFGNDCAGKPSGDYPACTPSCQRGIYYSCVGGLKILRPCQLGHYRDTYTGGLILRPLVYDHVKRRCDYTAPTCPRPLDDQVLTG